MANLPSYDELVKSGKSVQAAPETKMPSYEELTKGPETTSDAYDFVKAAAQGATLGGGDELLGAVQGTMDKLNNPDNVDWLDAYRQHQKDAESEYNKVKERSPVLSTVGEIAGGLLPVSGYMKAASGLGTLGKIGLAAAAGGAAGSLGSEGTLDKSPLEVGKDALIGAGTGGAFEGMTNVGGSLLKNKVGPALEKYIQDSPKLRQFLTSVGEGTEGKGFTGNANRERLQKELEDNASSLGGDLDKMKQYGQEQYNKVLENAPAVKVSDTQDLKSIQDAADVLGKLGNSGGARNKEALDILSSLKNGENVPANDLKELQKYLRDNSHKINQGITSDELSDAAGTANKLLKEQVPSYENVNSLHGQIQDPINSFIKNVPADEMNIASRPKSSTIDTNTFKAAQDVIKKSELPYGAGDKQANQLRLLKEGLSNLQEKDPEALKQMGVDNLDDYFKNIQKQSDIQAVYKGINKTGEMNKNLFDTLSPDLNTANKYGNLAGRVAQPISDYLYKAPKEALGKVSQSLLNNPNTAHLGMALQQSLDSPMAAGRNAALFSIMQNPSARKQIGGLIPGVEDEQQ